MYMYIYIYIYVIYIYIYIYMDYLVLGLSGTSYKERYGKEVARSRL